MKRLLASALAVVCLASVSFAQEQTVRRVGDGREDRQIQKLSILMKSKILIQEDQPAGEIIDVVLSNGGCVEYLVASYEQKYYVIPYTVATVRYPDQVVFVDVAPAQFRKVQFFQRDSWPDLYAANYRSQVMTVFNVNVRDRSGPDRDRPDRDRDRPDRDRPDRDRNPGGTDRPGRDRDPGAPRDRNDRDNKDRDNKDRPDDRNRDERPTDPARPRPMPQNPRPGDAPADPPRPSPDASNRDADKPNPPRKEAPKPEQPPKPAPAPKSE